MNRDFSFLETGAVKSLELTDRYMVAKDWSADYVRDFLLQLGKLMESPPEKVVFRYGPEKSHEDRYYWKRRMDEMLKQLSLVPEFEGTNFIPILRTSSQGVSNFHDRRISVRFKNHRSPTEANTETSGIRTGQGRRRRRKAGVLETTRNVIVELTGGVSIFMDEKYETSVYVIEQES